MVIHIQKLKDQYEFQEEKAFGWRHLPKKGEKIFLEEELLFLSLSL